MKTLPWLFCGLLVTMLAGCAALGPYAVDPGVYRASRDQIMAGREANKSQLDAQKRDLAEGGNGMVNPMAPRRKPANYRTGQLVNQRKEAVTFFIKGRRSLLVDVPAKAAVTAELPPGTYWVEIYQAGANYPYRYKDIPVSRERCTAVINDEPVDFFMVAP